MANYERLEFPKFRRPQSEEPLRRSTETDDDQMPAENLGDLLGRVSKSSTGGDYADERPTIKHVLASLVRVASGFHRRPSRTSATSVAPLRRTEMDFGQDQRLGTTLDLSEDDGS